MPDKKSSAIEGGNQGTDAVVGAKTCLATFNEALRSIVALPGQVSGSYGPSSDDDQHLPLRGQRGINEE